MGVVVRWTVDASCCSLLSLLVLAFTVVLTCVDHGVKKIKTRERKDLPSTIQQNERTWWVTRDLSRSSRVKEKNSFVTPKIQKIQNFTSSYHPIITSLSSTFISQLQPLHHYLADSTTAATTETEEKKKKTKKDRIESTGSITFQHKTKWSIISSHEEYTDP